MSRKNEQRSTSKNSKQEKASNPIKKITFCLWKSRSSWREKTRVPFMHPLKMLNDYAGLHASLLLFQSPSGNSTLYPFYKGMPKSAYPKFKVTSEFKGGEILCCEGRGNIPLSNENVLKIDSYVNFIPKEGDAPSFKKNVFKSMARSSKLTKNGTKLEFIQNPYEEACEEYFEYRHGREERLPEILLSIPVKTEESDGLDYDKICMWWTLVNKSDSISYKYFSENCAFGVLQALRAGGSEKFLSYRASNFLPITPNKVSLYTKKLEARLSGEIEQTTFEMVAAYIQKLIHAITQRNNINAEKHKTVKQSETAINSNFSFKDFLNDGFYSEHPNKISHIIKEISVAENSEYKDVNAFYLKKAQSHCAEFLFYHPDTPAFNLIANIMVKIDKEKEKNPDLYYGDLNEQVINLKRYTESASKKFGLFLRNPKQEAITKFFRDYPSPSRDDFLRLKAHLSDNYKKDDAEKLIEKIIRQLSSPQHKPRLDP